MQYGGMFGIHPQSTSSGGLTGGGVSLSGDELLQAQRLMHYKTYGEESYVFQHKDVWEDFLQSFVAINDVATSAIAFSFLTENNIDPLVAMGNIYGTGIDFAQYDSFAGVISDVENVNKILDHNVMLELVLGYLPYCRELFGDVNGKIWTIMDDTLAQTLVSNDTFKKYLDSLTNTSSTSSKSGGRYFLTSVLTTGRGWETNGGESGGYSISSANSGASYTTMGNTPVILRTAKSEYYEHGIGSQSFTVGKIVKSFTLTSATSSKTTYGPGGTGGYTESTQYHSTAYYKVICE